MRVFQTYPYNTGFIPSPDTDSGLDENGAKALGYRHVDALWGIDNNAGFPKTMNVEETVDWFLDVFKTLAYKIHNELNPRAVLDLGSGSGMLTYFLRQADPRRLTVTVDANQSVQANGKYTDSNHFWARTDKELNFVDEYGNKIYFDLVTSLEHFEHISQKTFDKLMENVLNHTKKGANLLATAALWPTEGQYEHVHCNVKKSGQDWYDYLLTKGFARANFSFPIGRAGESVQIFCTKQ